MKITQIQIGNFRSIYKQGFKPSNINILLGENDVGKSNVLHALNLFFNPTKKADFSDVHSDIQTKLLSIKVIFEVDDNKVIPKNLHEHLNNKALIIHRKHKVHQSPRYYNYKNRQISKVDLRNFFRDRFIYIPTVRDAAQHAKTVELIRELIENPSDHIGKSVLEGASEATKKLDRHMSKYLADFTALLEKNLKTNIKITFAPDIYEILQLAKIRIGHGKVTGRLQLRGQGIQSLTLINLYRAMAKKTSGFKIIALEEPEAHLHPHLLRSFVHDLFSYTHDSQIFLTTHSPLIIDTAKIDNVVRVVTKDSKTYFIQPPKGKIGEIESNFYKYVHARQSDIFFAKHVLLVEGPSDRHFLTTVSSKINYTRYGQTIGCDFEINGITALENEGNGFKNTIPLLELFEIPWTILCDKDAWEKGTLIALLEKTDLHKKKPKIFRDLKEAYEKHPVLDSKVMKQLSKFNIFCLNGKLEDFIITGRSKQKVEDVLKKLFPNIFKEAKSKGTLIDENFLKNILIKNKTTWAKPLAIELEHEDIHNEIIENIGKIVQRVN